MDWTGGSRRRFAAGKNSASVLKQKQHFARARGTAQKLASSQHPFRSDLLPPTTAASGSHHTYHSRHLVKLPAGADERERRSATALAETRPVMSGDRGQSTIQARPQYHDVVYVSSGLTSSSRPASRATSLNGPTYPGLQAESTQGGAVAKEDLQLLADRRRLLARGDWLGLSATRPLQMSFTSSRDKDRVAKRRKVARSSHRAKPAVQRLLTPLFEERLLRPNRTMSGALPQDDFHIKIGTDALATQTQPSRPSHSRANTSMRQPSTEFGPLSEESMLLGDEGDSFEAYHVVDPLRLTPQVSETREGRSPPEETRISLVPCSVAGSSRAPSSPMARLVGAFRDGRRHSHDMSDNIAPASTSYMCSSPVADGEPDTHPYHDILSVPKCVANEGDDEMWRKILHIQQYIPSHASLEALRSSSLHITTSSNSHYAGLCDPNLDDHNDDMPLLSTPRGAGTQGAPLTHPDVASQVRTKITQSPSASLEQILRLAELPALVDNQTADDDADDSAWRDFIIGSGDDDSEVSQPLITADLLNIREPTDEVATARLYSPATSGLGTSANATQGDISFVSGTTLLGGSQMSPPHELQLSRETLVKPDSFANAETTHEDDIEEASSPLHNKRHRANIHAEPVRIQSKRQFVGPKAKPAALVGKGRDMRRIKRRGATVWRQHDKHDIYDLIDSDGRSLA
ncbi:hypothetical protein LTR12_005225 [Friedmanniomyces endolithicus]|nr:hypothetical protein LTR74_003094 [Friedmanniomyces endolithicus]KAK1820362.1 hypothetical protein LTR12_005225 [Friedmanniomyces endolithicus]